MKEKWTVTKLVATASLCVLEVILELMSSAITLASGIMMASGLLTTIIMPVVLMNTLLIVDKFGTAFIFMTINGILTLPLALSGPPGFLPKVPILMALGLIEDVIYAILKRYNRLVAALVIGIVHDVLSGLAVIEVGRLLGVPGIDEVLTLVPLPVFIVLVSLLGAFGGFLGWLVFNRIKSTVAVARIRGGAAAAGGGTA